MCARYWAFDAGSQVPELLDALSGKVGTEPFDLAVILGSGWSHLADAGQLRAEFNYADWPCFPRRLAAGHAGRLVVVEMQGWRILFFAGRFHCYQGLNAFEAALPVRIASALGCQRILLTCAVGGINPGILPGDFVWVTDHLNLLGDNPLKWLSEDAFEDLCHLYDRELFKPLHAHAAADSISLHQGVLAAMPGPCYETPAEIRMLSMLGADVVSMSVVHEAIMARHLGLDVAALSLVANRAAGLAATPLRHDDVLDRAGASRQQARSLFEMLIAVWRESSR